MGSDVTPSDDRNDRSIAREMVDAFSEGDFHRALHLSRAFRARPMRGALALVVETRCLSALGRHAEAMGFFEAHRDELAHVGAAWSALADCFPDSGSHERLHALRQACRLEPTADRLALLGDALARQGDIPGAEAALRRALEMRPDHSEAKANLAYWVVPAGDRAARESLFREALRDDQENAFVWEQLGLLLYVGDPASDEALHALSRAVELAPHADFARLFLADLQWRRGNIAEARRHYLRLVDERSPFIASRVGEFFAACREFCTAERVYLRSLGEEENPEVLWQYGRLLRDAGQQDLGLALIRRASAIAPEDVRIAEDLS